MTVSYKVIPAPDRPLKDKRHKTPQAQFAAAIEAAINEQAADGWRYLRTDTMPCEVRQGLTGKTTVFRSLLVFDRVEPAEPQTAPLPQTDASAPSPNLAASLRPAPEPPLTAPEPPLTAPSGQD